MQDNQNTQDQNQVAGKSEVDYVERMKNIYREISNLDEDLKEIKEEAKEKGLDASLLAKVAKSLVECKADEIIAKNDKFASMVEKIEQAEYAD